MPRRPSWNSLIRCLRELLLRITAGEIARSMPRKGTAHVRRAGPLSCKIRVGPAPCHIAFQIEDDRVTRFACNPSRWATMATPASIPASVFFSRGAGSVAVTGPPPGIRGRESVDGRPTAPIRPHPTIPDCSILVARVLWTSAQFSRG